MILIVDDMHTDELRALMVMVMDSIDKLPERVQSHALVELRNIQQELSRRENICQTCES